MASNPMFLKAVLQKGYYVKIEGPLTELNGKKSS